MKCKKFILTSIIFITSTITPVFAENDFGPLYDENGARNARYDYDAKPILKNLPLRSSGSRSITTGTGGTLVSDTWVGNLDYDGHYDYQVAAKYDKTDHQNIKTTWYGEVTGTNVSFNIGVGGITIGASETTKQTEKRYWENTRSQQDSSYRADGYLSGKWKRADIYNTASVYGNSLGPKPSEVTSHASI